MRYRMGNEAIQVRRGCLIFLAVAAGITLLLMATLFS